MGKENKKLSKSCLLQKNQKQREQQTFKTLQMLDVQQQQQQQQQSQILNITATTTTTNCTQYKMPPLEYATFSPTRIKHIKKSTTTNIPHLPHCKYHKINQQQQQQQQIEHQKACPHHSPHHQEVKQHQHHETCQHSSPYHQQHQHQHQHSPQQRIYHVHHHHTLNLQDHKHKIRDYTIKTQHYKSASDINRSTTTSPTTKTSSAKIPSVQTTLLRSISPPLLNQKGIRRCRSYYNSFEDLDAKTRAEKKVVASLKYLCACTGATLRNLSKKTKNLHAKQQQFTFSYTKVNSHVQATSV